LIDQKHRRKGSSRVQEFKRERRTHGVPMRWAFDEEESEKRDEAEEGAKTRFQVEHA